MITTFCMETYVVRTSPPLIPFGRPAKVKPKVSASGVNQPLFYGLFALLAATNAFSLVAFLMSPDISRLMSGQNEFVLSAYEDRIAQLRIEVDRLHSRQYAQAGDINLQLQELAQQQETLSEQHQYVKLLAQKASELGIQTAAVADIGAADTATLAATPAGVSVTPAARIDEAADRVARMMDETRVALAGLSDAADRSTDQIMAELRAIGIRPKLPNGSDMGGPLLPAVEGPDAWSVVDDANAVMTALTRFKAARDAVNLAPIFKPVTTARLSSTFGNRRDPFTGRRAFHSGIDFPVPTGTIVISAGEGRVIFAGKRSGYGNVVEISHGAGLITRYAHLSAFLVKEGQTVHAGTPIAKAGSTGRSTGPHLHFEVRREDKAVDPAAFLNAGRRLQQFLS